MIKLDKLVDIYTRYGEEQNIQPLRCANEEYLYNDKLSEEQRNWIGRFSNVWEYTEEREQNNDFTDSPEWSRIALAFKGRSTWDFK